MSYLTSLQRAPLTARVKSARASASRMGFVPGVTNNGPVDTGLPGPYTPNHQIMGVATAPFLPAGVGDSGSIPILDAQPKLSVTPLPSAFWFFEEAAGNFLDSSVNGNTLTPHGGVTHRAPGRVGFGIGLDGSTGYASAPSSPSLQAIPGQGFYVAAWYNQLAIFNQFPTLVSKWQEAASLVGIEYVLRLSVNGFGEFIVGDGHGNIGFAFSGAQGVGVNQWNLAVGWWDPISQAVYCRLNDGPVGFAPWSFGAQSGSDPVIVGASLNSGLITVSTAFPGVIDCVLIGQGVVPTYAEMAALFNAKLGYQYGSVITGN